MSNRRMISREELFNLVWSKTKVKVAEELGISDVAVRKICKKLKIPMPPQGYWLRSNQSKPPKLPKSDGQQNYLICPPDKPPKVDPIEISPEAVKLIARESKPSYQVEVKERLRSPHPIVQTLKDELEDATPDDFGRIKLTFRGPSSFCVCPANFNRTLRILDAIFKAAEKRGYPAAYDSEYFFITVMDVKLSISFYEKTTRSLREFTPTEMEILKREPWRFDKYVYTPTNLVTLSIDGEYYKCRKSISDTKKQRL